MCRAERAWRARQGVLALAGVLLAALAAAAPPSALAQRGHSFSFTFGQPGTGSEQFEHPAGIALAEATGAIYVADRANDRVEEWQRSGEGKPTEVRSFSVPYPLYVAVDNSTEASDPSKGDVYVVGVTKAELKELEPGEEPEEGFVVYKFSAKGTLITKLKKVKIKHKEEEFEEEFALLDGVAVDQHGSVYVAQEEEIYEFDDASKNKPVAHIESKGDVGFRPGLAADSAGDIYVGVEEAAEGASLVEELLVAQIEEEDELAGILPGSGFAVAAKLSASTGEVLIPNLDPEYTSALAVNPSDEPANGVDELNDVYVTNVSSIAGKDATTVAAFNPQGELLQRFALPAAGGQGQHGDGIAVDSKTGAVYVSDAEADAVDVFELEHPGAPTVAALSACTLGGAPGCPTSAGAAKLSARVNPHGADTHYRFEYGPSSCGEPSACASAAEGDAGASFEAVSVGAELSNLATGTWHYRIVASNGSGEASEEHTFTILGSAGGLPDSRQWELVSPQRKEGGEPGAIGNGVMLRAAAAGGAITWGADAPIGEGLEGSRSPELSQVLSIRAAGGWNTIDLATPNNNGEGLHPQYPPVYRDFSPNLALALLEPFPGASLTSDFAQPPLSPPLSPHEKELQQEGKPYQEKTIYLRADAPLTPEAPEAANYAQALENGKLMGNPGYLALVTEENAPGLPFGGGIGLSAVGLELLSAATPDLSHVLFKSHKAASGTYEWGPGGEIQRIGEIPQPPAVSCSAACRPLNAEELSLGSVKERNTRNAISNDGTRIFFVVAAPSLAPHLYVRDSATHETLQLDVVQPDASGAGKVDPQFATASATGSKVFFTDTQRLTPDSRASGSLADLYVAELSGGETPGSPLAVKLVDLTPEGIGGESAGVPEFEEYGGGVLGASEGAAGEGESYVYFTADAALAPGAARVNCTAEEASCNLYVRHFNGSEWEPARLVAVLSGEDAPDWDGAHLGSDLGLMTSRVSPNGRYLAFMSNRSLTGYDNEDREPGEEPGERMDEEVYLYDAASGELACASCNPSGERPMGVFDNASINGHFTEGIGLVVDRTGIWSGHWLAANIPGWTPLNVQSANYQSRYLSNEGRLFFNSPDTLVPAVREEVAAGNTSKEKVYEYEPTGVGSCESAGGCIGLISAAGTKHEAAFLEASESGDDAFFLTAEPLVQQDRDEAFDIYDARVCETSSPCLSPPAGGAPPCLSTAECQGASYSAPGYQSPASTAAGAGNGTGTVHVLPETVSKPPAPKPLTPSQKLAAALKACKQRTSKSKRAACEKSARATYAAAVRAQKLAAALKACKQQKSKSRRVACEKKARASYGRAKAAKVARRRADGSR